MGRKWGTAKRYTDRAAQIRSLNKDAEIILVVTGECWSPLVTPTAEGQWDIHNYDVNGGIREAADAIVIQLHNEARVVKRPQYNYRTVTIEDFNKLVFDHEESRNDESTMTGRALLKRELIDKLTKEIRAAGQRLHLHVDTRDLKLQPYAQPSGNPFELSRYYGVPEMLLFKAHRVTVTHNGETRVRKDRWDATDSIVK